MQNYSQNNEQEIILKYFGDNRCFGDYKGSFLDIGAYNGVDISNTRALLELGWSGIMVEPNPFNLVDLINNCREFGDRAKIISGAVGEASSLCRLHLDDSPGRGWAATLCGDKPGRSDPSKIHLEVPVIYPSVLYKFGPFDLISIDAEWKDMDILTSFDIDTLRDVSMVIMEPAGIDREDARKYFRDLGFKIHAETPENIIAAR